MTSSAPRWTSYLLAAGLAALPAVVSAQAAPAPKASAPLVREQVERRLQSTTFLVEQSSAAKQVDTSGKAEAKARREKARELLAESRVALAAGDLTKANRAVETAARTMTEAVRMSAPEQVTAGKMRTDFDAWMYDLPFGSQGRWLTSGPLSYVLGGWSTSMIQTYQSGAPLKIYTGTYPFEILFNSAYRPDVLLPRDKQTLDKPTDVIVNVGVGRISIPRLSRICRAPRAACRSIWATRRDISI